MIKGIRLYIVVLFLASSIWIASSVNNKRRQRRQLMNSIYRQQLRNAKYFSPIPIRMQPYYRRQIETATSDPGRSTIQSPWMPLRGPYTDEINKNVYVPPIRSPSIIITKKPEKSTFNVPLTKSIQVTQVRPNQQPIASVRKKVVHVHDVRTTENPRLKIHGTVAESTIHSLLNFTPADDLWRPKFFTTPYPAVMPNHHDFGKKLGSKVDKHLNYTGIKYGTVNSVMKTMPEQGAAIKTLKNETNFVMKFTPEDVKYTSVEVKTEKIYVPFNEDSPDIKHSDENYENHRLFYNDAISSEKSSSDLRNEGNLPYQGHKTANLGLENNTPTGKVTEDYRDRKSVFDVFQNSQKTDADFIEKDVPKFQGQGSFLHKPYEAEKVHSSPENNGNIPYDRDRTFRFQPYRNTQISNLESVNPNYPNDNRNFRVHPDNIHKIGDNRHIKSNFPYQGHATVVTKPSFTTYTGYRYQNKFHFPNRNQQYRPPHRQVINTELSKNIYKDNNPTLVHNEVPKYNNQNIMSNYGSNNPIVKNRDFGLVNSTSNNESYKYNSVSELIKNNNTLEKNKISFTKDPVIVGSRVTDSPNAFKVLEPTVINKISSDTNNPNAADLSVSSPKLQPFVSVAPENVRILQKNQSTRFEAKDALLKKHAYNELPKLKEIKLKNPPDHLRFGDEDHFLKPMVPTYINKENNKEEIPDSNTLTKNKPETSKQQNKPENKELEKNLPSYTKISKVEYYEDTKLEEKKVIKDTDSTDNVYFQPVFPNTAIYNHKDSPHKILQKYVNEQTFKQIPEISKESVSKSKPTLNKSGREHVKPNEAAKEKYKINKDVIITKNSNYSPEDTKRSNILEPPDDMPRIITPPPVITMKYDPKELDHFGDNGKLNRTDNYVIQRKPALLPESTNRPRKPNITISTGMLAGILIAALVFLGFLTGSMVYAFHQWKFGRRRSDRQKTTRNPVFPPEYLDENFAGNTYIHNNIFLPTPPNTDDRINSDPDSNSIMDDEIANELPSTSARVRRHPTYRERIVD